MEKLKCDWCGSAGHVMGDAKSFPGVKSVKCDVCHHEWETLIKSDFKLQTEPTSRGKEIWNKIRNMKWI